MRIEALRAALQLRELVLFLLLLLVGDLDLVNDSYTARLAR